MARFKPIALVCAGEKRLSQRWSDTLTGKMYLFPLEFDPNIAGEGEPLLAAS